IQLHQFAEMRLAHPALAIRLSRSLAAPKSGRFHPAPQGLGGHLQSVFFLQVFRRQRRPEVRITPAYLNEHRLAKLLGVSSVGDAHPLSSKSNHNTGVYARSMPYLLAAQRVCRLIWSNVSYPCCWPERTIARA